VEGPTATRRMFRGAFAGQGRVTLMLVSVEMWNVCVCGCVTVFCVLLNTAWGMIVHVDHVYG
jgi:hypothetical protein